MKKMLNIKSQISNCQKGYTLIELLAAMVVLVSVGTIVTSILVSALRGGNKSNTINEVRQSGNYVIVQMSKMIAYARSFDGVSTDGVSYVTNCIVTLPPAPTPPPAPIQYKYIKISSFDNGQTVFSCSGTSIASNGASLFNTSALSASSCYFICSQSNVLNSPTIDINFTLSKNNSGFFVENQTTIPFETSVTLRND